MAIRIFPDKIQIGNFNLFEGNGGIQFDGEARAENFLGNQGFQGTVSGYITGGSPLTNLIQKFPFATNTNATDTGDLTRVIALTAGQSSPTHGYSSGGYVPGPPYTNNVIDKFLFSTDSNATDVGDISVARYNPTGQSSFTNGYSSGGALNPPPPVASNVIDKFPFATDSNATDVGDLTQGRYGPSGQSSITHGYTSGGASPNPPAPRTSNTIDKFSFATDANAIDVGDLAPVASGVGQEATSGQSSTVSGYVSGGAAAPAGALNANTIQKFPFATDSNATDIADLTGTRISATGVSSTTSGYAAGGEIQPTPNINVIDKFPFSTDTNATDVGDLIAANRGGGSVGKQF